MIAHATDVPATVLQSIHCHMGTPTLRALAVAVSRIWYALIIDSQIRYLWEQTLLGAHWKLFVIHACTSQLADLLHSAIYKFNILRILDYTLMLLCI